MIIRRYKSTLLYRHACSTACSVSLAVLLSACGSGATDNPADTSAATGSASLSAAQLAADDTNTLSLAQAAAAGLEPVQTVETSTDSDATVEPNVGDISVAESQNENVPELGPALAPVTNTTGNSDSDSSGTDAPTAVYNANTGA